MSIAHRFLRNPNYWSSPINRVANRAKPYENTLTKLEEPTTGRTLYLIGTTNSSSLLAYRTKHLIEQIKPDSVFVQATENFKNMSEQILVTSQQEMNYYNMNILNCENLKVERNIRTLGFTIRFYAWLLTFNIIKFFPKDFHPFIPGLEVKFALESAKKVNSQVVYGGFEIDQSTLDAFKLQSSINPFSLLWRSFGLNSNNFWQRQFINFRERRDVYNILTVQGGETFAESIDRFRVNWFVNYFDKLCPEQKKVLVDQKDESLFESIYRDCQGKTTVAVVNQWHMEGIETHWRNYTKTQLPLQAINPIGDFNINKLQENALINNKLREITSKITGSEPATWQDVITHYHKEVQEFERTRHVHFDNAQDHHMYHGLPEDSKDAPLKALQNENVPKLEQPDPHHH